MTTSDARLQVTPEIHARASQFLADQVLRLAEDIGRVGNNISQARERWGIKPSPIIPAQELAAQMGVQLAQMIASGDLVLALKGSSVDSSAAPEPSGNPEALNTISNEIQYWLNHNERQCNISEIPLTDEVHVIAPSWPSRGVLKNWIAALRSVNQVPERVEPTPEKWMKARQHICNDRPSVPYASAEWCMEVSAEAYRLAAMRGKT